MNKHKMSDEEYEELKICVAEYNRKSLAEWHERHAYAAWRYATKNFNINFDDFKQDVLPTLKKLEEHEDHEDGEGPEG